jgi:hypothetical protein
MRCLRCRHLLRAGADFEDTKTSEHYAVDEDGTILVAGTWCAPDRHVIAYDKTEVDQAARQLVRVMP